MTSQVNLDLPISGPSPDRVLAVLRGLRSPLITEETDLHELIARRLTDAGVSFRREVRLGPRDRIDFLAGAVGIECKKGKPNNTSLTAQAEDRAHRMGQKDSVLCYYLVAPEGTDQDIMEALGLKVSQFLGIMGDTPETEEDKLLAQTAVQQHMQRVVERLQARGRKGA